MSDTREMTPEQRELVSALFQAKAERDTLTMQLAILKATSQERIRSLQRQLAMANDECDRVNEEYSAWLDHYHGRTKLEIGGLTLPTIARMD